MDTETRGARIRALRQARGWSLQQLAERVGVSKPQIDKLERGTRRLTDDWIRRIAAALEVAPEALSAAAPVRAQMDTPTRRPEPEPFPESTGPDTTGYDAGYDGSSASSILDTDTDSDTLPLCGFGRFSARNGSAVGIFVEAAQAPERVWRPALLSGVSGAYAVRMPNGDMAPKYEAGQLLFVHPYRTPRPGDAVVVRLAGGRFLVGRLGVPRAGAGVTVAVLTPGREIRLDADRVMAVERVILAEEP
jgi:transcriptional regulator with XRE-family HTH domain